MKFYVTASMLFSLVLTGMIACKKKPKDPGPVTAPPVSCNTAQSTLVRNDTILTITADTAYATMNNTFYTEHMIAAGHGCSVEFAGGAPPAEGTYIITPVFNEVIPGSQKVYLQYYEAGNSYTGQGGNVTVTGSGTSATIEFCKINSKDSFGNEKTLSLKTDSE